MGRQIYHFVCQCLLPCRIINRCQEAYIYDLVASLYEIVRLIWEPAPQYHLSAIIGLVYVGAQERPPRFRIAFP